MSVQANLFSALAVNDGLLGHWSATLDQSWNDLTANANNMQIVSGSPSIQTDSTGYDGTHAFDFNRDNSDNLASINNIAVGDNEYSLCCWAKMGANEFMGAIVFGSSATANVPGRINTDRNPPGWIFRITNSVGVSFDTAEATWHHLVIAVDAWPDSGDCYIDGQFYETLTRTDQRTASYPINMGRAGGGYFTGRIDSVRFYNRKLSQVDVTELFNGGRNEQFGPPAGEDQDLTGVFGVASGVGQVGTLEATTVGNQDLAGVVGLASAVGQIGTLEATTVGEVDILGIAGIVSGVGQVGTLEATAPVENVDLAGVVGLAIAVGQIGTLEATTTGDIDLLGIVGIATSVGQTGAIDIGNDITGLVGLAYSVGQVGILQATTPPVGQFESPFIVQPF